ncbi:MAG: hypothetical protein JXR83_11340 [Deltaproteobacteria bacterium]|nr:hypothetical protein [Deltaproteobacteria bacterium]
MPRPVGDGNGVLRTTVTGTGRARETLPAIDTGPGRTDRSADGDRLERSGGTASVHTLAGGRRSSSAVVAVRTTTVFPGGLQFSNKGFTVDGFGSATNAGVTLGTAAVLEKAAQKLCALDANPFAGRQISAKVRAALVDHCEPFLLAGRDQRRSSLLGVRARAASFALMVRTAQAMTPKSEAAAFRRTVDLLLAAAQTERHPGLRRHMLIGLEMLPAARLSSEQKAARDGLVARLLPAAPPYDAWFGGQSKPELRAKQYVMEGEHFFRDEVAAYRANGWQIARQDDSHVVASKLLEDPSGKQPPVQARVELVKQSERVLDEIDDPKLHLILYSGHAQLGGVAKWSMDGVRTGGGKNKLVGFFSCRGKQSLARFRRSYPGAQLLVSNQGTYGNDDRIVVQNLFRAIGARESYAALNRAVESAGVWEKNNYIYPDDRRSLEHFDFDGDGRIDAGVGGRDLLFTPVVAKGRGNSMSFAPVKVDSGADVSKLDGGHVTNAVEWFNTVYFYWSEACGRPKEKQAADRFYADGWFRSDDPDELVRVSKGSGSDGKPAYRVQVNAAYAHLSNDALGALLTYGLALEMFDRLRRDEPLSERRLRALAMVGSYTSYQVEYSDLADLLLKKFGQRFGFPPTLTWEVVDRAVSSDHENEASDKVMRNLERGMRYPFLEVNPRNIDMRFRTYVARALGELRRSDSAVGRATYEALVTGRVKLDELGDLTRHDFMTLRRELLPDVRLEAEDFHRLHTEPVLRAITASVDGYMWDDRLYVSPGQTPDALATTLVHEVNHIINRSEENYRSAAGIFVEEYRAYYAEQLFRGIEMTRARCRALKEQVIRDYQLVGVSPDDVADRPPGRFAFDAGP